MVNLFKFLMLFYTLLIRSESKRKILLEKHLCTLSVPHLAQNDKKEKDYNEKQQFKCMLFRYIRNVFKKGVQSIRNVSDRI